jgi:hypothetical protein
MTVQREFVQRGKGECSNCAWTPQFPLITNPKSPQAAILEAFSNHDCGNYPRRKTREDVNQAAARIIRESTEQV